MNAIKRILGIVWILIGIGAVYYLIVNQAIMLWNKGGENYIPAIIYTVILCPMIAGALGTFGFYSLQGEFDSKDWSKQKSQKMPKISFDVKKVEISLNKVVEILKKSQDLKLFMVKL